MRLATIVTAALLTLGTWAQAAPPEGRLLRFPHVHDDFVVFVYGGDIWRAPLAGGTASRLTAHQGLELFPKISPDGAWIAFSAEYTGTRQVYVMPAWGGQPRQLTYYNDVGVMPPRGGWDNWVMGWTPDGKILVRMNRVPWSERMGRYFVVDPKGGLETPLILPEGGSASLSPDGRRIAYTPVDREFRTWKRTRGGRAQDVWIFDLEAKKSERLTSDPAGDNFPMWAGETIYFASDRDRATNIFAYDLGTKAVRKVTTFDDEDVLWPSLGKGGIVFSQAGFIHHLDLASGKSRKIDIHLATEATTPHFRDLKTFVNAASISPSGARVVVEARGELFSLPAKDGPIRSLTDTPGIREHSPAWSPDGRWIAYLSDESGEYEVWVRPQAGGTARRVTTGGSVWRYAPAWSPDSKKLAFGDRDRRLRIVDVASGQVTDADRSPFEDITVYSWSPDSRFIAYERTHATRVAGLYVYSLDSNKATPLGDGRMFDASPAWSPDGKYLFFVSLRDFAPTFSAFEFNYLYRGAGRVFVATLTPDTPPLFPLQSDEEKGVAPAEAGKKDADKKDTDKEGKKADAPAAPKVTVVADGFLDRTAAIPGLKPGDYAAVSASSGAVWYLRGDGAGNNDLYRYDIKERKEEKAADKVAGYEISADGKKLLYRSGQDWFATDAKAPAKAGDGKLDLASLRMKVDPKAEWAQMFADAWRIARDFFYDPAMHGTDWTAMRARYGALVPYIAHRSDLDFILGEMLSELEVGHTYVAAGDETRVPRVLGGMLGAELAADPSGRYRISHVYGGENWDDAWRSPLTEAGVNVKEGDFLLAIDGQELRTTDNPYRLLEGKANRAVVLKVARDGAGSGAREVTVKPIASEQNLRYLDWVRSRMALTDKLSGGKVGYVHLPNTALEGNRMLQKLFYAESSKPALIVDDRYNGGGFIPDRMIEMLSRKTLVQWAQRDVESMRTPGFVHDGPKVMLANGYSASGGDALPYFFRLEGLGKIVGTRTWGGLVGLSGGPRLMDGGQVQIPTFRIYDRDGRWVVENEGVAPDVEVIDLPEARLAGGDPSLEKAVEILLAELASHRGDPAVPKPPVVMPRR